MTNDFYNSSVKLDYLDSLLVEENSKQNTIRMLKKAASEEARLGRDIYDWTSGELVSFYKGLNSNSVATLINYNSCFSQYCDFCLDRNMVADHQNHCKEISKQVLTSCYNYSAAKQQIISREDLIKSFDNLANPSDKFVLLALFEGLKGDSFCELWEAKLSDISGNTMKLCTGREVIISDQLKELAVISERTYDFVPYNSKSGNMLDFKDVPDYIIKPLYNSSNGAGKIKIMSTRFHMILEAAGLAKSITKTSIRKSGMIHAIRQIMEQNPDIEWSNIIKDERITDFIENQYGVKFKNQYSVLYKYGEYLK